MNSPADMRSFEAARRRQLIEATIDTVADLGFRAASLSEIARRANVSQGLFAHYFGDKDGLLEATLRYMAARLPLVTAAKMRAAATPLERVHAVSDAALADREFERRTSAVWLAFWGQIVHSEPNRRVQSIYQRRMRSNLQHGLRELVAPDRVEYCSVVIAAAVDGLWLQSHAGDDRADKAIHARQVVRELTETLIQAHGPVRSKAPQAPLWAGAAPVDAGFERLACAQGQWSRTARDVRASLMRRFAEAVAADRSAIAKGHVRDAGLPVADTEKHDLPAAVRAVESAAERARRPVTDSVSFGDGTQGFVSDRPAPPVLLRVDASMALAETLGVVAHALADGRAIALCAPSGGVRVVSRLAELAAKAGLPQDLVTLAQGVDAEQLLLSRPEAVVDLAARAPKSVAVVTADADLRDVVAKLVRGPRAWARARAFSETVILADERVRAAFVERLAEAVAALELGDALDRTVEVGPLASKGVLERALTLVQEARSAGARIRLGGKPHETAARGRAVFLKPTIVDGVREADALASERLHAPIFVVAPFSTEVRLAERLAGCGPGLSLVAFGRDFETLLDLARAARPAVCRIDCHEQPLPLAAEEWLYEAAGFERSESGTRIIARRPARAASLSDWQG